MPTLKPEDCKIHLAVWNGLQNPLDVYLAGKFEEWQCWQNKENFKRKYIISLVKLEKENRWLFAGVHSSNGCKYISNEKSFLYKTNEVPNFFDLNGRLVINFERPGRQSYLNCERWADNLLVDELRSTKLIVEEFPGYLNVLVSKSKLDTIIKQELDSWKSALSNVAGVYLITDTSNGRHYVGSAYGKGGFWQRWKIYSNTGHGDNKILKLLLQQKGNNYSSNFQFSILETADTNSGEYEIRDRESRWKNVICSREKFGGYNAN